MTRPQTTVSPPVSVRRAFDSSLDWAAVVRIVLVLGVVGAAIGLLPALASLFRLLGAGTRR